MTAQRDRESAAAGYPSRLVSFSSLRTHGGVAQNRSGTVVPAGTLRPESLLDEPTTELVAGQAGEKLTSRALRIKHVQYHMLSVLGDDRACSLGF